MNHAIYYFICGSRDYPEVHALLLNCQNSRKLLHSPDFVEIDGNAVIGDVTLGAQVRVFDQL